MPCTVPCDRPPVRPQLTEPLSRTRVRNRDRNRDRDADRVAECARRSSNPRPSVYKRALRPLRYMNDGQISLQVRPTGEELVHRSCSTQHGCERAGRRSCAPSARRCSPTLGAGTRGVSHTPGTAPKSGFCLPLRFQPPCRRFQTILRADLSSTQQEQSKELIRS